MINYHYYINNNQNQEWTRTRWTHWTPLHTEKKLAKSRTKLTKKWYYFEGGMSSDLFTDTGLCRLFQCSTTLDNNSILCIFRTISCVKSVLKTGQDKKIKKFFQCEGVSTLSSMSVIIFELIVMSIIKHNNYYFIKNNNLNNVPEEITRFHYIDCHLLLVIIRKMKVRAKCFGMLHVFTLKKISYDSKMELQ